MTDFDEGFVVPEDEKGFRPVPKNVADEAGFYTAELSSESPVEDSAIISNSLQFEGTNPQYEEALERWKTIQTIQNRDATINIISDPNVDLAQKAAVVRSFEDGSMTSTNLKDQYVSEVGSRDVIPFGDEDIPVRQQDIQAQEIFFDKVLDGMSLSDDIQAQRTAYAASLNTSAATAIGGLITEVLSPLDLHALRSVRNAQALGITVKNEDLIGTDERFAVPRDDPSLVGKILNSVFDAFEFAVSPLDNSLFDIPRNFLFTGSLNKKVFDVYDKSTPEEKREILTKVLDSIEDIPGTDFQKSFVFREQIEGELTDPTEVALTDLFGFFGASSAAAFFRNPKQGIKWYTTFETAQAAAKPVDIKTVVKSDEISTKSNDIIVPDHQPTGSGKINATDDILVSTESTFTIPTANLKVDVDEFLNKAGTDFSSLKTNSLGKVFVQTEKQAAKGNKVVRVNAGEFEKGMEIKPKKEEISKARELLAEKDEIQLRLISSQLGLDSKDVASKDMLDFVSEGMARRASQLEAARTAKARDKEFVSKEKVEVVEAKVDSQGNVTIPDITQYNIARANGIDNVPLSMNLESILNANKKGYISGIPSDPTIFDVASLTRMARPGAAPNSPAGIVARANPVEANARHTQAVIDATEDSARHLGTTKGDIIFDSILPKLDIAVQETFPNIADNIRKFDENFLKVINNPEASLLDDVGRSRRERETEEFVKTFKENTLGTYNQANSTVHISRNNAEGIATFGRNDSYGWNTRQDAELVLDNIREQNPKANTRIVERNGSFWIEQEWNHRFDHIDRWMFDIHSMDSSLLGVNTSFLTRERLGNWIFPNTMKGNPDFAKTGFLAELTANSNEAKFFGLIRNEILATQHKKQLSKAMNHTQENQEWLSPKDLTRMFPELNRGQLEELASSYYAYRRGADYAYELANKVHRAELNAKGMQGLYDESGKLLGFGKAVDVKPREVLDLELNTGRSVPDDLDGKQVVVLNDPITFEGRVFQHALIGGKVELKKLPNRTLNKVEGWVPRKNLENWYIDFVPNSIVVDGERITDPNVLINHKKTIGAGRTLKEAKQFAKQLEAENDFSFGTVTTREATESLGDSSLTDYNLFKDTVRNNRKRGSRIRTINGFTRLEDPLEAFSQSIRSLTRINAWQPLKESFEKSFTTFAKDFLPTDGKGKVLFPNDVTQLRRPEGATPEDIKRFKVAQRLIEQFKEMQYAASFGDKTWQNVFNSIANLLEDVKWAGPHLAEGLRQVGKQGNLLVRIPKSLATNLFINLNPPRQWFVQPQQLLELNAISPEYRSRAPMEIPAVIAAVLSRAPHMKKYDQAAYEAAKKASLMKPKEFDEIVDAVYESGLPQAVDLNQMLYGTWEAARFDIDPSKTTKAIDFATNVVKAPGKLGKTIGYTPAEMANNIGTWLYSLDRWKRNNPGKNWNTPENVARITADSWDINHSMIGRAGAMPFQNGALGVLFQFVAVQQKGFMQLLSSKTLTTAEKTKLATARLALYGGYGIPLGAVGLPFLDEYMSQNASEETLQMYENNKGGFVDALANTTLDIMYSDSNVTWDIVGDTFVGKREGRSDITFSKMISPIPDTVPLVDMIKEFSNFADNAKPNPRFPGPQALGSFMEAVNDVKDLWQVDTLDTPEKLKLASLSVAQTASLFNNYGKSLVMKNFRDKATKAGQFYGLDVTDAEILAQRLGFTTREEELLWRTFEVNKERQAHIGNVANEVFRQFQNMEKILGTKEYGEAVKNLNQLMALSVDEQDIPEVKELVESKIAKAVKQGTLKQSIYKSIFDSKKSLNDAKSQEMIGFIRRQATSNDGDKRVVEMMENAGLIERE